MAEFDRDRDAVVARAREAGVKVIVNAGRHLASSRESVLLAERYPEVHAAVGFHPHDAAAMEEADLAHLEKLAQSPKVVALGEMGLDFYRNRSPREVQIAVFEKQLHLASQCRLPVIIHSRQAHEATLDLLTRWLSHRGDTPQAPGVMHCFSGDAAQATAYLKMGFYLSFAGSITYQERLIAEAIEVVPLERLLVETDSPFLTPHPNRNRRNEPSHVRQVIQKIAEIKGLPTEQVGLETAANTVRLFRLPSPVDTPQ